MKLELLEVELRPRSRWEGVDLGLALLQRWSAPVLRAWLATAGVVAAVLFVALRDQLWLWAFALWWLKPLFERTVVFVLSRAMFGSLPSVSHVLRSLREIWWRGLFRTLTWRRLTSTRALLQPVELLEGVDGAARRQRERVIGGEAGGTITLAAFTGWIFERALEASFLTLVVFFTPKELLPSSAGFEADALQELELGWLAYALCAAHFAAYSLTSTLHAASGFGLYLRCRTELEGWDIEVAFRRLGERVRQARPRLGGVASVVLALFALFVSAAPRAAAQGEAPQVVEVESEGAASVETGVVRGEASEALARVLARPEFETKSSSRDFDFDFDLSPSNGPGVSLGWLSAVFQVLALLAAAALALGLAYVVFLGVRRLRSEPRVERVRTTHVFGLDIRAESLPDDVAAEARALWRRGEFRAALGLLYRAAIARLMAENDLALEASDTESDCLARARRSAPAARAELFASITNAWLLCAYARSRPADEVVEALCDGWNSHFAARATEGAA